MKRFICVVLISILLILNSWRNIVVNINTNLPGWYDELFIIWIYQNNIRHFSNLDFQNIYETNAMYSFKHTLSFAEHMFFPSLLVLIINVFTSNVIAQFNILLILNHIFIYLASLFLFRKILKNDFASLIAAFYLSYSPYFFLKVSHFQMIFFWPMLLSLYFLLDYFEKDRIKPLLISGALVGVQFLSSVYLGVMNFTIILFLYVIEILFKKSTMILLTKRFLMLLLPFLLVSLISLVGYISVNFEYSIKRDYREFLTYSADLTDYIFPARNQQSLLYSTDFFNNIHNHDRHGTGEFATFPGILVIIFAIYVLFPKLTINKETLSIHYLLSKKIIFSIILILFGFIASLGPRLFINGVFTDLLLPYALLLKLFQPIGIIRVLARWHFLVILGFSILLGLGYKRFEEKFAKNSEIYKTIFLFIFLFLLFIEFYSLNPFPNSYKNWQEDKSYDFLKKKVCLNKETKLLEYPFHYRNLDGDLAKDVNYMAQILLNSTQHNCKILSGYYGFEPPKYIQIRDEFGNGFDKKDITIIKDLNINYIKFNKYAISKEEISLIKKDGLLNEFEKIYEDENTIILRI